MLHLTGGSYSARAGLNGGLYKNKNKYKYYLQCQKTNPTYFQVPSPYLEKELTRVQEKVKKFPCVRTETYVFNREQHSTSTLLLKYTSFWTASVFQYSVYIAHAEKVFCISIKFVQSFFLKINTHCPRIKEQHTSTGRTILTTVPLSFKDRQNRNSLTKCSQYWTTGKSRYVTF